MGELVPVCAFETLPGDTVEISNSALIRVTPLNTPVMHPVMVRFHSYFVPNRILDPEDRSFLWEDFITGGEDGLYVTPPPKASAATVTEGQIADYLGITPGTNREYNTFLPKAYAKIYNEVYRDQQLQPKIDIDTYTGQAEPLKVAWGRDYFTAARPEPQLGEDVTLAVGTKAEVKADATDSQYVSVIDSNGDQKYLQTDATGAYIAPGAFGGVDNLYADLSEAGVINVNDMRRVFALQRYKEARNLYGARFVEYLRYLGISSSDARLQRPEYIGGGKGLISFSEILSTDSGGTDPVGTMKGHGITAVGTRKARYFCEEHGHVITVMSARPKNIYMNSQHRMFNRTTKEEYWQKELQQIGQQPIYNRELYADHSDPTGIHGWTDRYGDFKHVPSTVAGEFRSTLNTWHLGRDFGADTALNSSFIECNPNDRIYADTSPDTDKLWCMINNRVAVRSMLRKNPSSRIL